MDSRARTHSHTHVYMDRETERRKRTKMEGRKKEEKNRIDVKKDRKGKKIREQIDGRQHDMNGTVRTLFDCENDFIWGEEKDLRSI